MKVLLEVKDDKAEHLLEVLKGLSFVKKIKPLNEPAIELWENLKEAAKQPFSNNENITNYFLNGGTEQLIFDINQNSISLPTITKSITDVPW